ncbi:NAD-dependent epimerase/dehydratase family protein [Luethyella okanaganae]|uniref:NAD-dependent epimerase/dehydratase family protein n=1 Tax=Luethyella okanaganae TaxID=69372 RepID=A0ABW1VE51_9MICO
MRVLVTGTAGRIGRAVIDEIHRRGDLITALVLSDPGDLGVDAVVVGSASDPGTVRMAVDGADAVVHLAAFPTPLDHEPLEVFASNTQLTFAVLDGAGAAGIRHAVIASSFGATGMPWSSAVHSPSTLPLTVDSATVVEDPYGLSKQVDELTATMMSRRHGMSVVSLRLPFVGMPHDRLEEHARELAAHPERGIRDLWSYLDTRDAARAAVLALTPSITGSHTLYVAAETTAAPYPTETLLAAFHPASRLSRPLPGRTVPLDLGASHEFLGFQAVHELELPTIADLPLR